MGEGGEGGRENLTDRQADRKERQRDSERQPINGSGRSSQGYEASRVGFDLVARPFDRAVHRVDREAFLTLIVDDAAIPPVVVAAWPAP